MADQKTIIGQTAAEVADVVDAKVTKAVTESAELAERLAEQMADILNQYGPDVSAAALSILRVDAIATLVPYVIGTALLTAAIAVLVLAGRAWSGDAKVGAYIVAGCASLLLIPILVHTPFPALFGIFVPEYWALVKAGVL